MKTRSDEEFVEEYRQWLKRNTKPLGYIGENGSHKTWAVFSEDLMHDEIIRSIRGILDGFNRGRSPIERRLLTLIRESLCHSASQDEMSGCLYLIHVLSLLNEKSMKALEAIFYGVGVDGFMLLLDSIGRKTKQKENTIYHSDAEEEWFVDSIKNAASILENHPGSEEIDYHLIAMLSVEDMRKTAVKSC